MFAAFGSHAGLVSPEDNLLDGVPVVGFFNEFAGVILNFFVGFAAAVAVIFILIGGFYIITDGGDGDRVTTGRKAITGAALGLVLIFLSYTLVQTVMNVQIEGGTGEGFAERAGQTVSFNYNIEGNPFFISLSKNSSKPIQQLDNATVAFDGNAVIFNCTKPHNFHDWERYVLGADGYGVRLETLGTPYTIKCLGGGRSQDINVSYSNQ